ncbi:MAG: AI-2E family transporter [Pseudomonadota bacterium]
MRFWLLTAVVFLAFMWIFRGIMLPFIAGMALAYFLDPVADWFERRGASRMVATSLILCLFLVIFVLALMIVIPILAQQLDNFIGELPNYIGSLQAMLTATESEWLRRLIGEGARTLQDNLNEIMREAATWLSALLRGVWNSGKALLDIVSLFVITPVVAFYLLYDWDRMIENVDNLLPRDHKADIREIASDIDKALAGFVRGQGSLCLILGLFYAVGLSLAGLNFGLLIGLFAGFVSFIPYVGSLLGLVLSVGVALVQFWPDYIMVGVIVAIFAAGQFLEGNILQPKLVGESVGLHPVWLMFALMAFGSLLGFTGMLIAVPAAAAVGVLVRFALRRYLASALYRGHQ